MKYFLIVVFGVVAMASEARAWGDTGHKVVCELALRLVAPQTRIKVGQMMQTDTESADFARACTWADHPRKRGAEHFLNLPRDSNGLAAENCAGASGCVVTAINEDFAVLASKAVPPQDRLAALKFLGHWVGDVHQPLHVSFADDRGGNDIKATGECGPNLHAVWDSCLVQKAVGDDVSAAAKSLFETLTPQKRSQWASGAPKDWANETFALAERPATNYCTRQGGICAQPGGAIRIDSAYITANEPVVREQLLKAAVRLARLLDEALLP